MRVAQRPMQLIGTIMRGRTEPCMRMKYGSLEWPSRSRGPTYLLLVHANYVPDS